MKNLGISVAALCLFALIGCKDNQKQADENQTTVEESTESMTENVKTLNVMLASKSGSSVTGEAVFTEANGNVRMEAKFSGLEPGTHAIHIHEKADCSADDASSAGGHWNPTFAKHGKWGDAEGYHAGDIGNFEADSDGNGSITMETNEWCIGCDDEKKNIIGKSLIVHSGADDYVSQPSGDAGGRVSCGGLIQ